VFTFAKFIAITPAIMLTTVARDSYHCACVGHLGRRDTDRVVSITCRAAQGELLLTVLLTNVANVNEGAGKATYLLSACFC
jgi:hypothetical protein